MESAYFILNNHLPNYTWPLLLLVFLVSLGAGFAMKRCRNRPGGAAGERNVRTSGGRVLLYSLLITYVAAILFSTLIFRTPASSRKAEWLPFWSWYEILSHRDDGSLFYEILLNILLFVPLGALLSLLYHMKLWKIFLSGFLLSASIETIQFVSCRGLFEWDDMLHNGLGCLIGGCAAALFTKIWRFCRSDG